MTEAVLVAVIALVAGAIGSLAAPWANWGVEKRREQRAHRRNLIASWRIGLAEWESEGPHPIVLGHTHGTFTLPYDTSWYGSLRANLSEQTVEKLENPSGHMISMKRTEVDGKVVMHRGRRDAYVVTVQREIDRLERDWKLA